MSEPIQEIVFNETVFIRHGEKLSARRTEEADEFHLRLQREREEELLRKDD